MALSHCWGDPAAHSLKTTRETLAGHQLGIPLDTMPPTFRDAVLICRNMGIQYLWIDSFCIIQGDHDDWVREGGLMGDIYQRAYFTIAATDSPDSFGGCFNNSWYSRFPLDSIKLPFYYQRTTSEPLERYGTFRLGIEWRHPDWIPRADEPCWWFNMFMESDNSGLGNSVLQLRGWITQEWVLSRRLLHYRRDRLIWHCKEHDGGWEDNVNNWQEGGHHPVAGGGLWRSVVERHSRRSFTFPRDKLFSLAGLVTALHDCHLFSAIGPPFEHAQRFGLWAGELQHQLLWVPVGIGADPDHRDVPSWSWASRLGAVSYGVGSNGLEVRKHPDIIMKFSDDSQQALLIRSRAKAIGATEFDAKELQPRENRFPEPSVSRQYFEHVFGLPDRPSSGGIHLLYDETKKQIGWICLDDGNFRDSSFRETEALFLLLGTRVYLYGLGPDSRALARGPVFEACHPAS